MQGCSLSVKFISESEEGPAVCHCEQENECSQAPELTFELCTRVRCMSCRDLLSWHQGRVHGVTSKGRAECADTGTCQPLIATCSSSSRLHGPSSLVVEAQQNGIFSQRKFFCPCFSLSQRRSKAAESTLQHCHELFLLKLCRDLAQG